MNNQNRYSPGDQLAKLLHDKIRDRKTGKYSYQLLVAVLRENKLKIPTVKMNQHGAVGRFYMCARRSIEALLIRQGFCRIGDDTVVIKLSVLKSNDTAAFSPSQQDSTPMLM